MTLFLESRHYRLKNGFDFSTVAPRRISRDIYNPNEINIIAVASFSEAHGYDRVLVGLRGIL